MLAKNEKKEKRPAEVNADQNKMPNESINNQPSRRRIGKQKIVIEDKRNYVAFFSKIKQNSK
jgi:hypothetical protein